MQQHLELSDSLSFPLSVPFALLSPYPLFHPLFHCCIVFLILSVNPALGLSQFLSLSHYSKHILPISPLSFLTASQNKDKVVIHLLHPCQQIHPNNPKRLTTRVGTIKRREVKKRQNAQGKASESHRERGEHATGLEE